MRNHYFSLIASLVLFILSSCSESEKVSVFKSPSGLSAKGELAHVEFTWNDSQGEQYDIYLKEKGLFSDKFKYVATVNSSPYLDWNVEYSSPSKEYIYCVLPHSVRPKQLSREDLEKLQVKATVGCDSDPQEGLLDLVQRYTTRYFVDFADPYTGMAYERSNSRIGNPVTTGGTGFGIMAVVSGVNRGYVSQNEAIGIFEKILSFLEGAERFHGAWAHWYNPVTGEVHPFSKYDDGGDLVETAFLVEGLIVLRQWVKFIRPDLCVRADRLIKGVEWNWYTRGEKDKLYWHWSKNYGWKMNHRIKGFDETFITYVLAAASEDYPIDRSVYEGCYKQSDYYYNGKTYYGLTLPLGMDYGGPLFFTHYSWMGLRAKGLTDGKVDYFNQLRTHALIQYNYAVENPRHHSGYGESLWGFTSSDDMLSGYTSHQLGTDAENGTVSPTAAIASLNYTPEQSLKCLNHLYFDLGQKVFGPMGFYDSYNPSLPEGQQVVRSYLAIDQGPIAVMIENYRSSLIWDLFMSYPPIEEGLEKLGLYYDNK